MGARQLCRWLAVAFPCVRDFRDEESVQLEQILEEPAFECISENAVSYFDTDLRLCPTKVLIIANQAYDVAALETPLNNAMLFTAAFAARRERSGGDALSAVGWGILLDASYSSLVADLHFFCDNITPGDSVWVFYSGHAAEVRKTPSFVGTNNSESRCLVGISEVVDLVQQRSAASVTIILDCFDSFDPHTKTQRPCVQGLADVWEPVGELLVVQSLAPEETATTASLTLHELPSPSNCPFCGSSQSEVPMPTLAHIGAALPDFGSSLTKIGHAHWGADGKAKTVARRSSRVASAPGPKPIPLAPHHERWAIPRLDFLTPRKADPDNGPSASLFWWSDAERFDIRNASRREAQVSPMAKLQNAAQGKGRFEAFLASPHSKLSCRVAHALLDVQVTTKTAFAEAVIVGCPACHDQPGRGWFTSSNAPKTHRLPV